MLHVNYARVGSLARSPACLHALCPSLIAVVFERETSPLSPIHRFSAASWSPYLHNLTSLPFFLFVPSLARSLLPSVRERISYGAARSIFLRAIKIISINRRLSDAAKTRWPSTRCNNVREMSIREEENSRGCESSRISSIPDCDYRSLVKS